MRIPKKQEDIALKNYLEYVEFIQNLDESKQNDYDYIIKSTIKIFYEISDEQFNQMPYQQVTNMYQIIQNILQMKQELVPLFAIDGKEYGIIPNFEEMTFGELVDCDTTDILQQMCVLYRPVINRKGKKYKIEKYNAEFDYEFFKNNLSLDIYNGFIAFFLKIQKDLMNYTLKSLKEEVSDPEKKQNLEKNGAGFLGSMNYVMEI